jgi:lipoprotein signal peptidase
MAAMNSTDPIIRRHVYLYGWFITIVSFLYFFMVSFMPVENKNRDFINIILGFLIGTAINSLIRFWYGSSNKSQEDTDKKMKDIK